MANFYDEKNGGQQATWEDAGGFNVQLLEEMRSAVIDIEGGSIPRPTLSPAQVAVTDWIKRLPIFDFPDDEIG